MTIFITILVFKYGICVYEDIIAQGTKGYNKIKGLIYTRHNFEFSISYTYIIQNTFIPSRIIKLILEQIYGFHVTNMLNVSNQTYGSIYVMALDREVP